MPDEAPDHTVQDTTEFHEQGDQQQQQRQPQKREDDGDAEGGEPKHFVDDKRNAILEAARKRKAETSHEFSGSDSDPKVRYGAEFNDSDLGPLEQEALRRQREVREQQFGQDGQDTQDQQFDDQGDQQQQQTQTRQRDLQGIDADLLARQVKIVVNGREKIITVEEALRNNMKIAAADDYFGQAKEVLRETKELRQEIVRGANQRQVQQNDGQDGDDQQYDDMGERRQTADTSFISDEDAEKIQMGTTEEVKATMAKLFKAAAPAVPQVDTAQAVRNALELERTKNDVEGYTKNYQKDFSDQRYARIIAGFTQEALIDDIRRSGITQEEFDTVLQNDPVRIKEFHRMARQRGYDGFRSPLELTKAGHAAAHKWRTGQNLAPPQQQQQRQGQPAPVNVQEREQRKQQLHQQPQQRRQAPSNLQQQTKTQDQGRSSRFAEIKKARGQPV